MFAIFFFKMKSLQLRLQNYFISYPLIFNHGRGLQKAARYEIILLGDIFSPQIVATHIQYIVDL